jgi:hypothetical protein
MRAIGGIYKKDLHDVLTVKEIGIARGANSVASVSLDAYLCFNATRVCEYIHYTIVDGQPVIG